jgi:acetyl-CoA carboxylase carboxyl transferase alpha subunit
MIELAARLGFPLVTLVDTPGADPGIESEKHGLASTIAHCLADMSSLPVPVVTTLIGEGGSGGALALAVGDQVLMLQHAIYEVIAPEGAAAILYRDASRAEQVAARLKLTANDCLQMGVVDVIVPEPPGGAHTDPDTAIQTLQVYLVQALTNLEKIPVKQLLARRYQKYRRLGRFEKQQGNFSLKKQNIQKVG